MAAARSIAAIATLVIAAADVAVPAARSRTSSTRAHGRGQGTEVDLSEFSGSDYLHDRATCGLAVLGIAAAEAIATYQSDLRLELAGERIIHELRLAIYAQLQRLSISFQPGCRRATSSRG